MRSTAKKTASAKAKTPKAPEPMDPDVAEVSNTGDTSASIPMSKRLSWSLSVLVSEVAALYPEATHYVSEVTGRDVGVAVVFEGWDANHSDNEPSLPTLLGLIANDERVAEVTVDDDMGWVAVRVHANPVTMDTRDPFFLQEAYVIATTADEPDSETVALVDDLLAGDDKGASQ